MGPVRFFVDGKLLRTIDSGPPYAAEWLDANPFDRCELAVEAEDSQGRKGRTSIVLEPYEVSEASEVTSVLLEAGVYDRKGHFVGNLRATDFTLQEDGVPQSLDLVDHERVPATFALLIDGSQSMSRRFDFVKDAAGRLTQFLRPKDRVLVAPFSTPPPGDHRADRGSQDGHRGDRRDSTRRAARRFSTRSSSSADGCRRTTTGGRLS